MILAIDTSTSQASIAIYGDDGPLGELSWLARRDHSTQLFHALNCMGSLLGVTMKELTAVTVAVGPGSFSGVRVGLSAGKALALGLGIPLVAVGTLDVIAAGSCAASKVWATLDAGRGQLYLASYAVGTMLPERTSAYMIASPREAAEMISNGDRVAGEGAVLLADELRNAGKSALLDDSVKRVRRAGHLAELGRAYLSRGGTDQSHEAEPLYLRRSAAEEKRDATQG